MNLVVNGEPVTVAAGAAVADLVAQVAGTTRGVAVAVNGDVVPRSGWDRARLEEGDRVEVLSAAQGG